MEGPQSTSKTEQPRCSYCGAPLSPKVYFCINCATPYKDTERVLPPVPQEPAGVSTKIDQGAPQAKTIAWVYLYTLICLNIVAGALASKLPPRTIMLSMEVVLFGLTLLVGYRYRENLKSQFAVLGFNNRYAFVGLALLPAMLAINWGYHTLLINLSGLHELAESQHTLLSDFSQVELILIVAIAPAIIEEIAFRGLLQHWLVKALDVRTAIIISSGLFAMMHFTPISFPIHFLLGVLFGWTKHKTGSLYPAMLLHFLHNFIVVQYL